MTSLYIFVEGHEDQRFVEDVLHPYIEEKHSYFKTIQYSQKKKEYVDKYIKSIKSMDNSCYILIADGDGDNRKIDKLLSKYEILDPNCIFLSVYEIESWIIAGLDAERLDKIRQQHKFVDTSAVTKEIFNLLIPARLTRMEFITDIYSNYSVQEAVKNNKSLFELAKHLFS